MSEAKGLAEDVGVQTACSALRVGRSTYYRSLKPRRSGRRRPRRKTRPARAMDKAAKESVMDALCSPRFADRSPAEVRATLLDEGVYLCSERTMYRVLADNKSVRERRAQRSHPKHPKPEIVARRPNRAWSWDVTRLLGPKKGRGYYLYVIMDIYSRYVVGWMAAERETAALAGRLIEESCLKQDVERGELTLHSDRGAPMTAKSTAQLVADLGIARSFSRPRVSNDNPYSEAQFKTLKYHPDFPGRFSSLEEAKAFCRRFFQWYNQEHRHAGIGMLAPEQVYFGKAAEVIERRQAVLDRAYAATPDRFVNGPPRAAGPPTEVWINPPILVESVKGDQTPPDDGGNAGKENALH